ncbi:hypothetical protein D3C74_313880 [compost metagenome]
MSNHFQRQGQREGKLQLCVAVRDKVINQKVGLLPDPALISGQLSRHKECVDASAQAVVVRIVQTQQSSPAGNLALELFAPWRRHSPDSGLRGEGCRVVQGLDNLVVSCYDAAFERVRKRSFCKGPRFCEVSEEPLGVEEGATALQGLGNSHWISNRKEVPPEVLRRDETGGTFSSACPVLVGTEGDYSRDLFATNPHPT